MRTRRVIELMVVTAAVWLLAASAAAWACGPEFPNRYLMNTEEDLEHAPLAWFGSEMRRIPLPERPNLQCRPTSDPFKETAEADPAELREAMAASGMKEEDLRVLVARYEVTRTILKEDWQNREENQAGIDPRVLALGEEAIPEGLPREFELYLRGAILYHQGKAVEARSKWEELLALPEKKRQYRSTWSAYMLGRSRLPQEPGEAIEWMEKTRELAAGGFKDRLGLACQSLVREAQARRLMGDYQSAVDRLLEAYAGGDTTVDYGLRKVMKEAFAKSDETLKDLAARASSRDVTNACVASCCFCANGSMSPAQIRSWLEAVEASGATEVATADLLAWSAYQQGEMDLARRWAERAKTDRPLGLWVRAKLAMREGKLPEALEWLERTAKVYEKTRKCGASPYRDPTMWYGDDDVDPYLEVRGEMGVVRLSLDQYEEAIGDFLGADSWMDAAYVAERVFSADELIKHVADHWPVLAKQDYPGEKATCAELEQYSRSQTSAAMRYLLARRLTREGRWKEARPYYPEEWRPRLDEYIGAIRRAHQAGLTDPQRGAAFWEAGDLAKKYGMELMGTEVAPDWTSMGGSFELSSAAGVRLNATGGEYSPPWVSEAEKARIAAHPVVPDQRFHYRYTALDHYWDALQLMPDENDDTARRLCEVGSWMKNQDPEAVQRFYLALVRRCGRTKLGKEADQKHWFPESCE